MRVCAPATFSSRPIPHSSTISDDEPEEMNGSGTPVSGARPSTVKTFSSAWHRISEVTPTGSSSAYAPFAAFAVRSPAYPIMP